MSLLEDEQYAAGAATDRSQEIRDTLIVSTCAILLSIAILVALRK
jgi:hypothetical protein